MWQEGESWDELPKEEGEEEEREADTRSFWSAWIQQDTKDSAALRSEAEGILDNPMSDPANSLARLSTIVQVRETVRMIPISARMGNVIFISNG